MWLILRERWVLKWGKLEEVERKWVWEKEKEKEEEERRKRACVCCVRVFKCISFFSFFLILGASRRWRGATQAPEHCHAAPSGAG